MQFAEIYQNDLQLLAKSSIPSASLYVRLVGLCAVVHGAYCDCRPMLSPVAIYDIVTGPMIDRRSESGLKNRLYCLFHDILCYINVYVNFLLFWHVNPCHSTDQLVQLHDSFLEVIVIHALC